MRLIDYDALYQELLIGKPAWIWANYDVDDVVKQVLEIVKAQPTVEAVKHGRWILDETIKNPRYQIKTCSLCGCRVNGSSFNYCPACGVKMDGDKNVSS